MDSEQIAKHEAAGCPLARELRVLRQMCSCRGDMASVDEAEARYLELRALEQREAVSVAWRWRDGSGDHGIWHKNQQDKEDYKAQCLRDGCEIEYAYATPPRDVPEGWVRGFNREWLGRMVRDEWIAWAKEQPNPKPSWLVPWDGLSEPDREVDRRIGERLYRYALAAAPRPDKENGHDPRE